MKTIDLEKQPLDLEAIIRIARQESVLLLLPDGKEFCIAEADDFDREIEALRQSKSFQKLLEQRATSNGAVSLEEVEKQITREMADKERNREGTSRVERSASFVDRRLSKE